MARSTPNLELEYVGVAGNRRTVTQAAEKAKLDGMRRRKKAAERVGSRTRPPAFRSGVLRNIIPPNSRYSSPRKNTPGVDISDGNTALDLPLDGRGDHAKFEREKKSLRMAEIRTQTSCVLVRSPHYTTAPPHYHYTTKPKPFSAFQKPSRYLIRPKRY